MPQCVPTLFIYYYYYYFFVKPFSLVGVVGPFRFFFFFFFFFFF
jgi:hypothetical protein